VTPPPGGATAEERLTARVVAHALIAVQRALVLQVREAVLADDLPAGFADWLAGAAADAFAVLERAFGGYGAGPGHRTDPPRS
jgi:hypothetical protein